MRSDHGKIYITSIFLDTILVFLSRYSTGRQQLLERIRKEAIDQKCTSGPPDIIKLTTVYTVIIRLVIPFLLF